MHKSLSLPHVEGVALIGAK